MNSSVLILIIDLYSTIKSSTSFKNSEDYYAFNYKEKKLAETLIYKFFDIRSI